MLKFSKKLFIQKTIDFENKTDLKLKKMILKIKIMIKISIFCSET